MKIVYKPEEEKREKTAAGFAYKYIPAKICIIFNDDKKTEVNFHASYFAKCERKVSTIENAKDDKEKKKAIKELTERKPLTEVLKLMEIKINNFACSLEDAEKAYENEVFTGLRALVNYLLAEENAKAKKKAKKKIEPAPVEPVAVEPVAVEPAPVEPAPVDDEEKERERVAAKMEKMTPFEKLIYVKLYNAGLTA